MSLLNWLYNCFGIDWLCVWTLVGSNWTFFLPKFHLAWKGKGKENPNSQEGLEKTAHNEPLNGNKQPH